MNAPAQPVPADRPSPPSADPLQVDLVVAPVLCFAMEQSGVPLIRAASVRNEGAEIIEGAELRLELSPGLAPMARFSLPSLRPGASVELGMLDLPLPPGALRQVTARERAALEWRIEHRENTLASGRTDLQVLPFQHWPGSGAPPELLASFVTPGHAVIAQLLRRTAEQLQGPLDGYQRRDPAVVRAQVAALFEVICSLGLAYAEPPAGFEQHGQPIRFPDQVLSEQLGCCLDVSVLFASCLEQMGLAPLLIVIEGHAFPAVWLTDDRFPEGLIEDLPRLRNQIALGQVLAFESLHAVGGRSHGFEAAVAASQTHLARDDRFRFALDVRACRTEYRPLPLRQVNVDFDETPTQTPGRAEVVRLLRVAADEGPPPPPAPPLPDDVATRLGRWKDRLLDLTLRNKLLNYRPDARASLPLSVPDLAAFEDLLASGQRLEIVGRPIRRGGDQRDAELSAARLAQASLEQLINDLKRDVLHSPLGHDRLGIVARDLIRAARLDQDEGGVSTLYVAVGLLRWVEPGKRSVRLAPLILYPVTLELERARGRVHMKRTPDEEPVANVTLIEKLRRDVDVDLSRLAELATDDSGLDIQTLLREAREAIQAKQGFEILEEAHLARFSFSKFLMWKDLEDHASMLLESPVMQHLAGADSTWEDIPDPVDPAQLDAELPPQSLPMVLEADASQQAAVASVLRGRSFVLQGPPGTGKSQTITNLIAAAMADGKRVLFVSEKMAALEVVHRRLVEVGLGDFCIELHSQKTQKKQVLASLGAALERPRDEEVIDLGEASKTLVTLRGELNAHAEALHRERPIGSSVYEVLGRLRALNGAPEVRVPIEGVASLKKGDLDGLLAAAVDLRDRAKVLAPLSVHPWRHATCSEWSATLEEQVLDDVAATSRELEQAKKAGAQVSTTLGLPEADCINDLGQLAQLALAASRGPLPAVALSPEWESRARGARSWMEEEAARASTEQQLLERWEPPFLEQPALPLWKERFTRWAGRFALLAWLFLFTARRALRPLARQRALPPDASVRDDVTQALTLRETASRLAASRGSHAPLLDDGALERAEAVVGAVSVPTDALQELVRRSGTWDPARRAEAARHGEQLGAALTSLKDVEARLRERTGISAGSAWARDDEAGQLDAMSAALTELSENRRRFRERCLYVAAGDALRARGHGLFVERLEQGHLAPDDLLPALEHNLLSRWLLATTDAEPALSQFDVTRHERRIEQFRREDALHLERSRKHIVSVLERRLPEPGFAPREAALLRRELQKKTRHLATRRLLKSIPELLPRLKSCFLMSPLSVAQYLPPDARFDLVVFDEASQIGTHDAVGAIARGHQFVVVGDSRQLPPTSFFQRGAEDEEEEVETDENDVAELESVLEEAQAKGLPQQLLSWHYRSRHDALIAFSNHHYYDDRLTVFPAARQQVEDLGVSWHHVPDGVFLSGSERTNLREAEALVGFLVDRLRVTSAQSRSFGVVTFSLAQRTLIEDLLDQARVDFPEIEPHFSDDHPAPLFVKNLENVQGDERDEMYFSIGYAKDEKGRLRMHFGPLSTTGGERRLNVAITRAKMQLRVFSTLRAEDIDLSRTRAVGTAHLRSFLAYAARGASARSESATPSFITPLERDLFDTLSGSSHLLATGIGSAADRVELAIRHPSEPGVYALGVELDGPSWARAFTARDRERGRQMVLEGLGWKLHRVWSLAWARDPERARETLLGAVEQALSTDNASTASAEKVQPAS